MKPLAKPSWERQIIVISLVHRSTGCWLDQGTYKRCRSARPGKQSNGGWEKVGKSGGRSEWDPKWRPYPCHGQYCCEEEEQVPTTKRSVIMSGGIDRCCVRERHNNKGGIGQVLTIINLPPRPDPQLHVESLRREQEGQDHAPTKTPVRRNVGAPLRVAQVGLVAFWCRHQGRRSLARAHSG